MLDINIDKIIKNYGFGNILNGISFNINHGDKIALIGDNGCGKSTLLKIITGEETSTSGKISIRKNLKIGYISQTFESKNNIKVKDIIYNELKEILDMKEKLEILEKDLINGKDLDKTIIKYTKMQDDFIKLDGYSIDEKIYKNVDEFNIRPLMNKYFNELSSGQKTFVLLCSIMINKPDILILDEPTNHLDICSLEWLEQYLNKYDDSIIMVSHDRFFLDKIANKTILIEDGKAVIFFGNYNYYLTENKNRLNKNLKDYTNQQKAIKKLNESAKKLRTFGKLGGNEIFFKRAFSIEKRIEKINKVDKPKLNKNIPMNFSFDDRTGNDILEIKDYTFGYNDNLLFNKINMQIYYRDRACLIGSNGTGKSTLIKKIINNEFKLGTNVKIGFLPQELTFENEQLSVLEYASLYYPLPENNLRSALFKYGFNFNDSQKHLNKISGGERVRIKLFSLVNEKDNFLILDEPTNHIDIKTKEILEKALKEYTGTILFISHDRYFINQIANKIFELNNLNIKEYYGNYNDYKSQKNVNNS